MVKAINIGFGNVVNTEKVVTIISPDSAPAKRLVQHARDEERLIDATQGRRTRAIIVLENGMLVLSALMPDTLAGRFNSSGVMEDTGNE